jgi:hypothetical protein
MCYVVLAYHVYNAGVVLGSAAVAGLDVMQPLTRSCHALQGLGFRVELLGCCKGQCQLGCCKGQCQLSQPNSKQMCFSTPASFAWQGKALGGPEDGLEALLSGITTACCCTVHVVCSPQSYVHLLLFQPCRAKC